MRKLASIRVINKVFSIKGKDRIQGACIDGWQTIVPKSYKEGTVGVFFEIDSVFPDEFVKKFNLRSKRIKTMKMSGIISQGLFISLSELIAQGYLNPDVKLGDDVTAPLGVTKYEPDVKEFKSIHYKDDNLLPFPYWIQKTDEERVQNLSDEFLSMVNAKDWVAHEKIDGQSITFYAEYIPCPWWKFWGKDEIKIGCCTRNYEVKEHPAKDLAIKEGIFNKLADLAMGNKRSVYIQGELIGPEIQGNRYSKKDFEWYLFNVGSIEGRHNEAEVDDMWHYLGCRRVPRIGLYNFKGVFNVENILNHAEGNSSIRRSIQREGIVIRHYEDGLSFKAISNKYLLQYE